MPMFSPSIIYSSPVGIVKSFNLQDRNPFTVSELNGQSITSLCWKSDKSFLVGCRNGQLYHCSYSTTAENKAFDSLDEQISAVLRHKDAFVATSINGTVRSYDLESLQPKTEIKLAVPVGCARLSQSLLATGGKNSNLMIWDLNCPEKPIFSAKNVRQTTLQLEVPIWISDICFVPRHSDRILLTTSRYGEMCLYDIRCGQRRPVSRHAWRMSRKYGKVKVGTCSHGAILPDLTVTRPITRGLAFADAPGVGIRVVAGNAIGDLCFLDLRLPKDSTIVAESEQEVRPGKIKSRGARAPEPPVGVQVLPGASGSITGLACGGVGSANTPHADAAALFDSQPIVISTSLDRFIRIYNRDTGDRLAKLYAKLPITSFLISSDADFSKIDRVKQPPEEEEDKPVNDATIEEEISNDEEFNQLWDQLEPVGEEAMNDEPKRKKAKRKRGN